jgi:hypothetical protein
VEIQMATESIPDLAAPPGMSREELGAFFGGAIILITGTYCLIKEN